MGLVRIAILGISGLLLALVVKGKHDRNMRCTSLATVIIIMLLTVESSPVCSICCAAWNPYIPIDTAYMQSS